MAKIDKISQVLSEWAFGVAKSVLPQVQIPIGGTLGGIMQILGVNPASYNIWNELGFLAEPLIETMVSPAVRRMLAEIPEEQVEELALKYVDAFIQQTRSKGSVNLFGIQLEENDLKGLRSLIVERLKEE
jgi:hypothetical protein